MTAAAMDDELFRVLRDDAGMPESAAAKVAKLIFRRDRRDDEFVTKTERETERDVARAVREAERAADREAFAAKDDVTVLQNKVENTDSAIERIDKRLDLIDRRFERMDEKFTKRFDRLDELAVRADEKVNGLQSLNRQIVGPLLLLLVASMFGLLTKGILWGVVP